jgi:thiol-disulfide isomerase/thioredoxin
MSCRIPLIVGVASLFLVITGCSDSGTSSETATSQQSTTAEESASQPSWALTPQEVGERAQSAAAAQNGSVGLTPTSEEDLEFERVWSDLQGKEQSHLIFVTANKASLDRLDAFLEKYPESRHREMGMYMAAVGRWSSYDYGNAANRYQAYLAEFPNMRRSSLARMRHAQSYVRSDQPEMALKVLDAYKQSNLAFQRELVRAEALALAGRVDEAKSLLRSWMVAPEAQTQQERTRFEARKLLERIEVLNVFAPNFETYAYNNGEIVSMEKLKGNVVLVDFWKSTCNPCMTELPKISDLYDRYKADGFEVLAVNMDTDINGMELGMEIIGADWPVHYDGLAFDGELAQLFGVNRCPHTVLIDRNGIIRAVDIRFDTLARLVPQLLSEPVSN